MNLGFLTGNTAKGCSECKQERDLVVQMEPTQVYDPSQCCHVDAWQCPKCDRTLYREEGGEVRMTAPDGERL